MISGRKRIRGAKIEAVINWALVGDMILQDVCLLVVT